MINSYLYQRQCPICLKILKYKTLRTYNQTEELHSNCRSCCNAIWRIKHPNTFCAVCNKAIYRNPSRLKDIAFCTYGCRNTYYSGQKSFAWKGGPEAKKERDRTKEHDNNRRKKQKAVNLLGGKCNRCEYSKCLSALEFHHLDPLQKDLSIKELMACSWKRIEEELRKCILVCCRCHREIHNEQHQSLRLDKNDVGKIPTII